MDENESKTKQVELNQTSPENDIKEDNAENDKNSYSKENDSDNNNKISIVPFKKYFLKIYKSPEYYYVLDRHKYDINAVMMLLDLNKINKLSKVFQEYKDGIEKSIFINRMRKELPCNLADPMDETNLVYGLYKFFKEVDFNGFIKMMLYLQYL